MSDGDQHDERVDQITLSLRGLSLTAVLSPGGAQISIQYPLPHPAASGVQAEPQPDIGRPAPAAPPGPPAWLGPESSPQPSPLVLRKANRLSAIGGATPEERIRRAYQQGRVVAAYLRGTAHEEESAPPISAPRGVFLVLRAPGEPRPFMVRSRASVDRWIGQVPHPSTVTVSFASFAELRAFTAGASILEVIPERP